MCGCELHFNGSGPCTCSCPDHYPHRLQDRRQAKRSETERRLADAEAEVTRLCAEVYRLNNVISSRVGGAR